MKRVSNIIKMMILIIMLFLLLIPYIQRKQNIFSIDPLFGYNEPEEKPIFSRNNWFSSVYSVSQERYLNNTIGFRASLIRMYNQLHLSLFSMAPNKTLFLGKNDYWFAEVYYSEYAGRNFKGIEAIKQQTEMLCFIEDTLKKLRKDLIIVVVPGKVSNMPENLPQRYQKINRPTNHQYYSKYFNDAGLNYIDFDKYLFNIKHKTPFPLFPKYGVHWSDYAAFLATDSLLRYIEKLRRANLPGLMLDSTSIKTADILDNANDLARVANLVLPLAETEIIQTHVRVGDTLNKTRPSILVVADSYFFQVLNLSFMSNFHNGQFWFYNNIIYTRPGVSQGMVADVSLKKSIDHADIVVILSTVGNLYRFGFGFIEDVYNLFRRSILSARFSEKGLPVGIKQMTGLSDPEPFGRWSCAKEIILEVDKPLSHHLTLSITAFAFGPNTNKPFICKIGNQSKEFRLSENPQCIIMSFSFYEETRYIHIIVPDPIAPAQLGLNSDKRKLGLAIEELKIFQ